MEPPKVRERDWITFASGLDGYVLKIFSETELEVGYYQNNWKAIKENVVWTGERWEFKYKGVQGRYLEHEEEAIVKAGPFGRRGPDY